VVAVPSPAPNPAFISCGTWSLAGLELDGPVLGSASREANFTNEGGIDGTVRYLRNIMGMWLLEECRRSWRARGLNTDVPRLLADAARATPFAAVIDPDDAGFLAPADMPTAIGDFCVRSGQRPPEEQGAVVRCILESLALAHRRVLRQAAVLSGRDITRVHMVGGGSRNELLCQFTADATGLPVIAGPAEATALGNILVQARAHGAVADLQAMRALVAGTQPLRGYEPAGDIRGWNALAARIGIDD
jgi:rhamnulokinase